MELDGCVICTMVFLARDNMETVTIQRELLEDLIQAAEELYNLWEWKKDESRVGFSKQLEDLDKVIEKAREVRDGDN